jgi:hypothetical protein
MKLGDFLNTMASKIGKQNDSGLIGVLSLDSIKNIDLPDELANAMNAELMSLEGAKNNASIKSHFKAEALNGVDAELKNLVKELGWEDGIFDAEKDTYAKVRALPTKVKDLLEKKSNDGGNKAELQKQIVELNHKMAQSMETHKAELDKINQQHASQFMDWQVSNLLKGFQYANKDVPSDVNVKFAKTLLDEAFTQRGVKLVNDNGVLKLKQSSDPSLEYFDENHKPVAFPDFASKLLAESKLLAVTDPKKGNTVTPPLTVPSGGGGGGSAPQQNSAKFEAALRESFSGLTNEN